MSHPSPHQPFAHDAVARKLIEEMRIRVSSTSTGSRVDLRARLDELEVELRFLSLFSRSLLEVFLRSEQTTLEEVFELMKEIDLRDGKADGGLEPPALAEELGAPPPTMSKEEKLRRAATAIGEKAKAKASKKRR